MPGKSKGPKPKKSDKAKSKGCVAKCSDKEFQKVIKNFKIEGDLAYQKKVVNDLHKLYSTKSGKALLESISKSGKNLTIKAPAAGKGNAASFKVPAGYAKADGTNGKGSDVTVYFDPDKKTLGGKEAWRTRPPAVALGHELIHADDAMYGRLPLGDGPNGNKAPKTTPNLEKRAVGLPPYEKGLKGAPYTENSIRKEMGQPARPYY
jgi:hypothetical protein